MNNHNVIAAAQPKDAIAKRRLIVLVPEFEIDAPAVARRIYELAKSFGCQIQLLGLSSDSVREPGIRRQMTTLSAMMRGEDMPVELHVEFGNSWLDAVKSYWHEGDVIVCFSGHRVGVFSRPLHEILQSQVNAAIYLLSECNQSRTRQTWISDFMIWTGSCCIILLFFWLQINLLHAAQTWGQIEFYISLFFEAGFILAWNSLLG